jgi:aquaporin Z
VIEGAGLGFFLVIAAAFATLLEYPGSPVHHALPNPTLRRALMGLAMGLCVVAIVYSPWGKRSGAHLNPAITLTFLHLGKVRPWDAFFYVLAQVAGGSIGVLVMAALIGPPFIDPPVRSVATLPGPQGSGVAFIVEMAMAFGMMLMVLCTTNTRRFARSTGLFAGLLVAMYIFLAAPLSGMSMNPARSFASDLPAHMFHAFWVYLLAPTSGMLLAAETYTLLGGHVICAKLHHRNRQRCIFNCGYRSPSASA